MATGHFEKLKIYAYNDPACGDDSLASLDENPMTAMINPENYTLEKKVEFNNGQAGGTSGTQPRFEKKPPGELSFEFLYDNTGIIDGNPREDISEDLAKLDSFLMGYGGEIHQTRFFKFVWGSELIKGVCSSLSIAYKLFNPDGKPIRAICKVTIRLLTDEEKRVLEENNQSPDLTHFRIVKKGDTLPLMCYKIYGNSKYYLQVAAVNKLSNFRNLTTGSEIFFPPFDKTKN
jgi:Contractile injection system tube protein